ncbi:DUF3307 domain-containing protein [Pseudoponticoccus marisrubri]|uniref:DUF3307 domain-containing protein n=1 Tax=Pseudoponticoccus marisrubri TaxID=1685382 RepID=A0A0W7WMD9_9RHOB|nr:DUF3307 domain-containing protein [Pseudoponticoccus marisrubri]KUF11769.1 hypothetical protein AVJ23_04065 [Pseudoponticoccus marisrubri]
MLAYLPFLSLPALQVFAALLLAHVVADFLLQPDWMLRHKRNVFGMTAHIAVVFGLSTAALGGVWQVALPVALAHLLIDVVKSWILPRRLGDSFSAFALDQLAHLATLIAAALAWPGAAGLGLLAPWLELLLAPALLLSGLILTVTAGGFAVGLLTARFPAAPTGMKDAGRLIGQLERALIFLLVFAGQPAGIGFLIAAKSILRFDAANGDHATGEYVIIGTLASFSWALAMAYATRALLEIAANLP